MTGEAPDPAAERQRLKRLFHDMRGSLNIVIGMSELLMGDAVDPNSPLHREFLSDVLSAGRRLLELVNDFSSGGGPGPENGEAK